MPTLSEADSRRLVEDAGVAVSPWTTASDAGSAAEAAEALGLPVVVKLCGDAIAHKTERGLVRLNLRDAASVAEATEALLASAQPEDGARGVLIAPMVGGTRELIAGTLVDPTFGKCVMLGIGGIFAEALADVTFRLIPLSRQDAEDMIANLEHQSWFREFRGEPEVNRDELVAILLGLSRIAQNSEEIVSIDINPLIISEGSPIAVDALVEVKS